MAWFRNCLYFIVLLYFTEIFSNVMSKNEDAKYELYLCFVRQLCECEGGIDNYRRCYSLLEEENQQWFLEEMNSCNVGKFTGYNDITEILCSIPVEEFYPCFIEMEEKLRKKAEELSKNPMKTRESAALEAGRGCIMPNFSMCADNPEDCL